MHEHMNCWDFKQCGRGPGGSKVRELGICPAATNKACHQTNGGTNGGRVCWAVVGTFCNGERQGSFAQKVTTCMTCDFYRAVSDQSRKSGSKLVLFPPK